MQKKFFFRVIAVALVALWQMPLSGHAELVARSAEVDFGVIDESAGEATRRIYAVNSGTAPIAITRIRTTCGCTAANYYTEEIAPGDSAWIDVSYNPAGRLGSFEKSIKVYSSEGDILRIGVKGKVKNTRETVASRYPYMAGPLMLTETTIMGGKLKNGEQKTYFINFYNMSDTPLNPAITSEIKGVGANISSPIDSNEIGSIAIFVNEGKALQPGTHHIPLTLTPDMDNPDSEPTTINVYIEIGE